jgi:hypothetical protein
VDLLTRLDDPDERTLANALALAGLLVLDLMGSRDPHVAYLATCADLSITAAEGEVGPRLLRGNADPAAARQVTPPEAATFLVALREGLLRWATSQPFDVAIDAVGAAAHLADAAQYLLRRTA